MAATGQELHGPDIPPFFRLADADIPIDLCSWLEEVDQSFEALKVNGTVFSFSDGSYSEVDSEEGGDACINKLKADGLKSQENVAVEVTEQPEYSLQHDPGAKRVYRKLLLQLLWPLSDPDINILQVYENTKIIDRDYHDTDFHRKIDLWKALSVIRKQLDMGQGDSFRLQSIRLNIEYCMFKSFEEEFYGYAMARNPFMIHWLEFIDGEITNPDDRIVVYFIRGLLKGDAPKFERATPREIIMNTDWKYDLDTKSLRKKLSSYDLDPPRIPAHRVKEVDIPFDREVAAENTAELKKLEEAFLSELQMDGGDEELTGATPRTRTIRTARSPKPSVNTASKQEMAYTSDFSQDGGANTSSPSSGSPTSSSTSVDGLDCANSPIHNLLYHIELAVSSPRTQKEKEMIYDHLKLHPEDLYETDFLFFDDSFPNMLEVNKDLANFLLRTYLFAIPEEKIDSKKRAECLVNISRLPITIFSLELITNLLIPKPDPKSELDSKVLEPDMAHLLLHRFLATSLRNLEEANSSGNLLIRRRGVAEKVSKLCVMIKNLMAKGFIVNRGSMPYLETAEVADIDDDNGNIEYGFDNYFYEMQELGLKFVFVKEARKVWESYRKGGGGPNGMKGKGKERERVGGGPVPVRPRKNGVLSDID